MARPTLRTWFRFSLRTLLVLMTALCLWLGYATHWIRQRRAAFDGERVFGASIVDADDPNFERDHAPFSLRLLGEHGWAFVQVREEDDDTRRQLVANVRCLFPEAEIIEIKPSDFEP